MCFTSVLALNSWIFLPCKSCCMQTCQTTCLFSKINVKYFVMCAKISFLIWHLRNGKYDTSERWHCSSRFRNDQSEYQCHTVIVCPMCFRAYIIRSDYNGREEVRSASFKISESSNVFVIISFSWTRIFESYLFR